MRTMNARRASAFPSTLFEYAQALAETKPFPSPNGLVPVMPTMTMPAGTVRDTRVIEAAYDAIARTDDGETCGDVFEWYRPQSIRFRDGKPHPTALMESVALASTRPPVPRYVPQLPAWTIREGALSEAQIETIAMAGEAHSKLIEIPKNIDDRLGPDDEWATVRTGFMNGDGPGTGKGRTTIGLVLDARARGRRKALWITENARLFDDAKRDNRDLGGKDHELVRLAKYGIDEAIKLEEGVVFSTYAMLRSRVVRKNADGTDRIRSRMDQIVEWLGGDTFDGIIVFDESQNLQNAVETVSKDFWSIKKPSAQAATAIRLQELVPMARIVYASATSGDRLQALAYAPRLGLWGRGTAFPTRDLFLAAMTEGGTTALEMICRDLKATGLYCSRQISNVGVTSELLVHELDQTQIDEMNDFNRVWRAIAKGTEDALVETGNALRAGSTRPEAKPGSVTGRVRSKLQGAKLLFYSAALVSLRMPSVIVDMKRRLTAGESCVVQLHNTQEAALVRSLERWEAEDPEERTDLADLDVTICTDLVEFVEGLLPVQQQRDHWDSDRKEWVVRPETDPLTGLPVENKAAVRIRRDLVASIRHTLMPKSPLDWLIEEFGTDVVAEITGRKQRMIWTMDQNGKRTPVIENRTGKANAHEVEAFMNGPKRVLAFSDACGGVGASYHASLACANQTKRYHYIVQIPWRAIEAIQSMGRTHRTNQKQPPHYMLATTNLPCEKRSFSVLMKRMGDMGSLTRGQRDAGGAKDVFSEEDDLQSRYGEQALREMMTAFDRDEFPNMTASTLYDQTGIDAKQVCKAYETKGRSGQNLNVNRFLTRLLGVDIDTDGGMQKILLDGLLGTVEDVTEQAIAAGTYDAGLQTIDGLSIRKLDDVLLRDDPRTAAQTRMARIERTEAVVGKTWDWAKERLQYFTSAQGADHDAGWFTDHAGKLALHVPRRPLDPNTKSEHVRTITPYGEGTRIRRHGHLFRRVTEATAKKLWERSVADGQRTKTSEFTLVYGALLPIWNKFGGDMPTIWRMRTDDGERLLGRRLATKDAADLLRSCATP